MTPLQSFLSFYFSNFTTILFWAAIVDLVCWGTVAGVLLWKRTSPRM